jgi:hypothetical protein
MWRISFRATPEISMQGEQLCNVSDYKTMWAESPQKLISHLLLLLWRSIEICLRQRKLPLSRHLNPLSKWSELPRLHAATVTC